MSDTPDSANTDPSSEDNGVPAATPEAAAEAAPEPTPTPEPTPVPAPAAQEKPVFADKTYRSGGGIAGGGLLLVVILWLTIDAMVKGSGTSPELAAAVLVGGVPLVVAFTIWPVVRSGAERLLVRNPLRTIDAPWGAVESVTATLSVDLRAGGRKFVIWALPVSLRQRKRAGRRSMIAAGDRGQLSRGGRGGSAFGAAPAPTGPTQAVADKAALELNGVAESYRKKHPDAPTPDIKVSWNWPLIAPTVVGTLALVILLIAG